MQQGHFIQKVQSTAVDCIIRWYIYKI